MDPHFKYLVQSDLIEEDVYCEHCERFAAELMETVTLSMDGIEPVGLATWCYECGFIYDVPDAARADNGEWLFLGHRNHEALDDCYEEGEDCG